MRLSNERYEFIKGEVVALFERYDVKSIPISGYALARKMGVTMIPYTSLPEIKRNAVMKASSDGLFIEDINGRDFINYNDDVSYPWFRYSNVNYIPDSFLQLPT